MNRMVETRKTAPCLTFWIFCNNKWSMAVCPPRLRFMLQLYQPFMPLSTGAHNLVIRFLRGARRLRPSRPPTVPSWDLALVLEALALQPFEPLQTVGLRELSLKTALLLALASVKHVGDLQALSVNADCMQFGLGDCNVTLKPRLGYVPKWLSTPFRVQVVALSAFTPESAASSDATPNQVLCPVRALRVYIDRTAQFRQSQQLFVCLGAACLQATAITLDGQSYCLGIFEPGNGMSYWCPIR